MDVNGNGALRVVDAIVLHDVSSVDNANVFAENASIAESALPGNGMPINVFAKKENGSKLDTHLEIAESAMMVINDD